MLSEEERLEIERELENLPTRRAGSIDALKIVQKHRRYVSDEALKDLAPILGMTPASPWAGMSSWSATASVVF